MRMSKIQLAQVIVLLTPVLFCFVGCSDKTQTPENKALTKQRQDKINAHKNQDQAGQ
jgi:hypothetical protein